MFNAKSIAFSERILAGKNVRFKIWRLYIAKAFSLSERFAYGAMFIFND